MTAPNITPGPVFKAPSLGLDQAAANFVNAMMARQQLAMKKQQLELEKQRTEAQVKQAGQATAESKARTDKTIADLEQQLINNRADDAANDFYLQYQMGVFKGEDPIEARVRLQESIGKTVDRDIKSETQAAFMKLIDTETAQRTDISKAEIAKVDAETAQTMADTAISANRAQQAASNASIYAAVSQEAVRSGTTWGQAADLLKVDIDPDLRDINPLAITASGKRGSDMQQRATVFLTMMGTSIEPMEATLQEIEEKGGLNLMTDAIARTNPKGFWSNLFISALNTSVPEEQQAVISYMRNFVASWQYFASGAQINEGEYSRLVDAIFPRSTDGVRARQAKRAMRATTIEAIKAMALGGDYATPVEPMYNALKAMDEQAARENWPPNLRRVIKEGLANTEQLHNNFLNRNKTVILNNAPAFISPKGEIMNPESSYNMPSDKEGIVDAILGNPTSRMAPAGTAVADSATVFDLQPVGGR